MLAKRKLIRNIDTATDPFIISINTALGTGANIDLRTVLPNGYSYDFTVQFGDGGSYSYLGTTPSIDSNLSYIYSGGDGIYQLEFSGKVGGFSVNNGVEKLKVISIDQWGDVEFDFLSNGFNGCANLESTSGSGKIQLSSPTSLISFFANCTNLKTIDSDFLLDAGANVIDVGAMFYNCYSLLELPDVSAQITITDFDFFAHNCYSLSNIPNDYLANNVALTSCVNSFYGLRNPALPATIFNLAAINIITNFNGFLTATSASYSATGTIQDIWNYATSATKTNAFSNQTAITNYADIPNDWKGL